MKNLMKNLILNPHKQADITFTTKFPTVYSISALSTSFVSKSAQYIRPYIPPTEENAGVCLIIQCTS